MNFLSILLFVISSNIDSIIIGLSLGIKKIKIRFNKNIIISSITSTGTLISMFAGNIFNMYMPAIVSKIIGSGFLLILGIYIIISSYKNKKSNSSNDPIKNYEVILNNPEYIDKDNSKTLNFVSQ